MVRELRILACAYACSPTAGAERFGGGESVLGWNMVKQLARFHRVWVLTHAENRPAIEANVQREPLSHVRFHYLELPRWLGRLQQKQGGIQFYAYLWQIRAYIEARRLHGRFNFELFHHITYANDWMASFIGALLPIPYIRGPGGGAHRTPKGFTSEYSLSGRLWEKLRGPGQWFFRHDPVFIMGQRRAQAILLCNRESVSQVPHSLSNKVRLFPVNGVSSKELCIATPRKPDDLFHVFSAGSLIRVKGFGLSIKAFKEFSDRHPEAEFTIAGGGPEKDRLTAIVSRLQLQAKVRLLGAMPHDELLANMAACDVFLFPSLRDGGGTVVIEAMAAGKPVVCLDTGGPGMHISKECGIKIAPRTPEHAVHELAGALERLYLDEGLRHKLGKAAREKAEQEYHWDRLGARLMETYGEALDAEPN